MRHTRVNIRQLRSDAGLSISDLAKHLGMAVSAVYRLQQRKKLPRNPVIRAMAVKALGLTAETP
jgi:ribosome-binding protein aMBF1 (putative translation factor)